MRRADGPLPQLTGREREVLTLIAGGMTNKQIADRLYPATASTRSSASSAACSSPRWWTVSRRCPAAAGRSSAKRSLVRASQPRRSSRSDTVPALFAPTGIQRLRPSPGRMSMPRASSSSANRVLRSA
ncbi:helix-turn-helix transcriptional regulator [Actinomadura syzygii]|uniref:Helix-turn-helix transcriptional regulator n=1 Tax=Actinomadura syzygii TaxID=1427538 RepID=A0A5D0UEZ7_9ACTN|nr:helix-turn-helix transcriptional regulator [Actinomadura syzygii]